jgi:hypothetical protein
MVVLLMAAALGGALIAGYWQRNIVGREHLLMARQAQQQLDSVKADLARVRAQADAAAGQLMVEESTRKSLEATLASTQAELGRAREQLAFFDQLWPPGPKGSVSIRALEIQRMGSTLQYKVLLMRSGQEDTSFKGRMQFVGNGLQDGKAAKLVLQAMQMPGSSDAPAALAGEDDMSLAFDKLQRSGGLLSLPEGFTPQTVTLNILEGTALRVSRTVNVPVAE